MYNSGLIMLIMWILLQQRMGLLLGLFFHRGLALSRCSCCFSWNRFRVLGRRGWLGKWLSLSWRLDVRRGLVGFCWRRNLCWVRG